MALITSQMTAYRDAVGSQSYIFFIARGLKYSRHLQLTSNLKSYLASLANDTQISFSAHSAVSHR